MTVIECSQKVRSVCPYGETCGGGEYKEGSDCDKFAESLQNKKAHKPGVGLITREQVEKVWRGEWVKRHKHRGGFRRVKGFDDMGEQHEVTIDERCEYDDLYCSKCGKQSPDNFLNFCGYCGAPMTDEAVQMVMERLEALHEKN